MPIIPDYPITRLSNSMSTHVDLVGVLFILWGLLTTLVGLSTLALGVGAVALMSSGASDGGGQFAAGIDGHRVHHAGVDRHSLGRRARRRRRAAPPPPPLVARPRADARLGGSGAAAVRHGARLLHALGAVERGGEEALRNAKCQLINANWQLAICIEHFYHLSAYLLTPGTMRRPPLAPLRMARTCRPRIPTHANTTSRTRMNPSPRLARLTRLVTTM